MTPGVGMGDAEAISSAAASMQRRASSSLVALSYGIGLTAAEFLHIGIRLRASAAAPQGLVR